MLQVTDDNFMLTLNAKEAEWVTFADKGGLEISFDFNI